MSRKFREVKNIPGPTKIYISSKAEAEDQQLVTQHNIKIIMEVSDKTIFTKVPNTTKFYVYMDDPLDLLAPNNPLYEAVEVFEVAYNLANKRNGNILIHCVHGSNRSSLVAALFIHKKFNIPFVDCVKLTGVKDNKPWMQAFGLKW